MSLITAYFKADKTSVTEPAPTVNCNDNASTKSEDSAIDPVVIDEDSNSKDATPPKKMKIALFTVPEPTTKLSVNCNVPQGHVDVHEQPVISQRKNHVFSDEKHGCPVEKHNEVVECADQLVENVVQTNVVNKAEKLATDTIKEATASAATAANLKDNGKQLESVQTTKRQQSRQTTLNFLNGKCVLVPLEPDAGMISGSQESSQLESTAEEEHPPKMQQRKRRKKKKERTNIVDSDTASQDENVPVVKKPCRQAAKEATERLNELLTEMVPCSSAKPLLVEKTSCEEISEIKAATHEESHTKVVPQIVVEDNLATCSGPPTTDTSDVVMVSPSVEASADSSDSDVICLTPRSVSPLSQELQSSPSKPSTPAKNKWAHIFGVQSPHKKLSSPGRKSSPRKRSPRNSPRNSPRRTASPSKQALVMSSTAVSHEQYSLGVALFHHVMQQDSSPLWSLPKIGLPGVGTIMKSSPLCHSHRGASQHIDHGNKGLIAVNNYQTKPYCLKVSVCACIHVCVCSLGTLDH